MLLECMEPPPLHFLLKVLKLNFQEHLVSTLMNTSDGQIIGVTMIHCMHILIEVIINNTENDSSGERENNPVVQRL